MKATQHRGTTLLEVTAALVVLSLAFAMLAQLIAAARGQSRAAEQRRLALQEAANVLERVAAMPWADLTPEKMAGFSPSATLLAHSPGSVVRVVVEPEEGPPSARRVRVEVASPAANGEQSDPVGLTAFRYPPPEAQP